MKWISVKERLPEPEVPVLVYSNDKVLFGENENGMWWVYYGYGADVSDYPVTHWMPLPEPPESGIEEMVYGNDCRDGRCELEWLHEELERKQQEIERLKQRLAALNEKESELLNAYQRMIEMYQFEVRQREKEQDELLRLKRLLEKRDIQLKYHTECTSDYAKESIRIERELRSLMDSYIKRQEKLHKEIEEAKRDGDVDAEMTGEALYRQMRHVIAELFQTMKKIGILDDEEIKFGCVKENVRCERSERQ